MPVVLYFAAVREAVGAAQEQVALPADVTTAGDLAELLAVKYPIFSNRTRLRVAIDQTMAAFDADIRGAREIAFFPPVTGG